VLILLNARNSLCRITLVIRHKFRRSVGSEADLETTAAQVVEESACYPARRPRLQSPLDIRFDQGNDSSSCLTLRKQRPITSSGVLVDYRDLSSWSASICIPGRRGGEALSLILADEEESPEPRRKSPIGQEHFAILRQFPGGKIVSVSILDKDVDGQTIEPDTGKHKRQTSSTRQSGARLADFYWLASVFVCDDWFKALLTSSGLSTDLPSEPRRGQAETVAVADLGVEFRQAMRPSELVGACKCGHLKLRGKVFQRQEGVGGGMATGGIL
jgi:hypothetical protein